MSVESASTTSGISAPTQWLMMSLSYNHDALEPALFSTSLTQHLYEPPLAETQPDAQSTDIDNRARIWAGFSSSIPPPPPYSLPPATFYPPNWHEIPQRPYDYGRKQLDYTPSEPILFQVNGSPGVNMGDALRESFAGLEGRDDLVLQDVKKVIYCRFLFPGYPPNKSPQIPTTRWNKGRDPITRSKLAHHVARKLKQYLDSMMSSHIIDASTDERWTIGESFMHLDNMFMANLESVSIGSFQPQIWVIDPAA